MPYFVITDSLGAVLRVDDLLDAPTDLEPGLTATPLAEGQTPAQVLRAARPLAELRAERLAKLMSERDQREFGTFSWDGSTFDCDERSQARLQGAVTRAERAMATGTTFSVEWTLADNTVRLMSAADLVAAGDALLSHVATLHATGRLLRSAVMAAETADEVDAVAWP